MSQTIVILIAVIFLTLLGVFFAASRMYKKVRQGRVMVRTGFGGTRVFFNSGWVVPIFHKLEIMDISVKKLEIARKEHNGLICKDNMRADIEVAFFVRVNKSKDDIVNVAQTIGCERASDIETLRSLFEAKFSEALKSVGKKFDFTELYEARREFRDEIINIIGTDLNGYILDDCAIDYLEQTGISYLSPDNILDSEGIKKITELTAGQNIKANLVRRDEEKTIKKQDVEAREAILELEKQLSEKEEIQKREVANIKSREEAETKKVAEEERLKAESVRISTDESLAVAEENKNRQIIVAAKNKERTEVVETERVIKDRDLEATERQRVVALAEIEKEKAVEIEKKNIQDAIRDRVALERTVVEEQEKIKDVEAFKEADRKKQVALTIASQEAEENLIEQVKLAEARKQASEKDAQKLVIEAQAQRDASEKEAEARKIIADAKAKEEATVGLSEAQVMHAKADAAERQGVVEASIIEKKATAQAKEIQAKAEAEAAGIHAKASAEKEQGLAQADVIREKAIAEADGIDKKAESMKKLNEAGQQHEEFRLRLQKDKEVELAQIGIQKNIAEAQAKVLAEAFKTAKIDIVGGESTFFEHVSKQITAGKGIDKLVESSDNITALRNGLMNGSSFGEKINDFIERYNISSEDVRNLSLAALLNKLRTKVSNQEDAQLLDSFMDMAKWFGVDKNKLDLK